VSGNGYGTHLDTRESDQAAYDASPPWLRHILRNAVANWSSRHMLKQAREAMRVFPEAEVQRMMIRSVLRTEREDAWRFYGPAHPEADTGGKRLKPVANAAWSPKRRRA
jgi:hypothetical protein